MNITDAIRTLDENVLIEYLQQKIDSNANIGEVLQRYHYEEDRSHFEDTTLFLAIKHNRSIGVIEKLLELGGRRLVMEKGYDGYTVLHLACENENISVEIISKLVEVGGRVLVMEMNDIGETALHRVCENPNVSFEMVSILIEAGGRELVMAKGEGNMTALHCACGNLSVPNEVLIDLISEGGQELIMGKDDSEDTALHHACNNSIIPEEMILLLIEVGGKELVMTKGCNEFTAFYFACRDPSVSMKVVTKFIEVGGQDLLMPLDNTGDTSLHQLYFHQDITAGVDPSHPFYKDIFLLLLKESIHAEIGGEFGIGGLFGVASAQTQSVIYNRWNNFLSLLQVAFATEFLQTEKRPSLLHAAIHARAPLHVFQNIINHFDYNILKRDSLNRYPIDLAIEEGLILSEGMKNVIEATATVQQCPSIFLAAQYGLKWSNGMEELSKSNVDAVINDFDSISGLRLFMVAAEGSHRCELSSTYGLMRMDSEIQDFESVQMTRRRMQ